MKQQPQSHPLQSRRKVQGFPGLIIIRRFPDATLEQLRQAFTRAIVELDGALSPRKLVPATVRHLEAAGLNPRTRF